MYERKKKKFFCRFFSFFLAVAGAKNAFPSTPPKNPNAKKKDKRGRRVRVVVKNDNKGRATAGHILLCRLRTNDTSAGARTSRSR